MVTWKYRWQGVRTQWDLVTNLGILKPVLYLVKLSEQKKELEMLRLFSTASKHLVFNNYLDLRETLRQNVGSFECTVVRFDKILLKWT